VTAEGLNVSGRQAPGLSAAGGEVQQAVLPYNSCLSLPKTKYSVPKIRSSLSDKVEMNTEALEAFPICKARHKYK